VITLIDTALLDAVSTEARASPRRRKNRNFHRSDEQPGQRLLNAIEPGSFVAPHRHADPDKDETIVVLRGMLGLVLFDDDGNVVLTQIVGAGGMKCPAWDTAIGVDIPHGTWHTVLALEPGTVFLEAKAGPYRPLAADERAAWAPAEGAAAATSYLAGLARLFE
jgi:cupin fold WbuC family metalloprotein